MEHHPTHNSVEHHLAWDDVFFPPEVMEEDYHVDGEWNMEEDGGEEDEEMTAEDYDLHDW